MIRGICYWNGCVPERSHILTCHTDVYWKCLPANPCISDAVKNCWHQSLLIDVLGEANGRKNWSLQSYLGMYVTFNVLMPGWVSVICIWYMHWAARCLNCQRIMIALLSSSTLNRVLLTIEHRYCDYSILKSLFLKWRYSLHSNLRQ